VLVDEFGNHIYDEINNHKGGFQQAVIVPPGGGSMEPAEIVLVDVNGDGNLDAVTGSQAGAGIYLGNGKGQLTYYGQVQGGFPVQTPSPLVVADVNGDGIPDISLATLGTVAIFIGEGNGTFEAPFCIGSNGSNAIVAENLHDQAKGLADLIIREG
jgi:FG-GAP-like repeat